jgi:hypothetical protein
VTAAAVATLVWLATPTSVRRSPDAEEHRAIAAWARAHGVVLDFPAEGRPPALTVDPSTPDRVEDLLDRTRDAVAAGDANAADAALDRAEALLRAHPELPQAAWLMAEVERARSVRWRHLSPADPSAADRAWTRADALDHGRVAAVGERATAAGEGAPQAATAPVTIEVSAHEQVRWDGAAVLAIPFEARAGSHALVVTWNDAPVWAGWIEVPPGGGVVRPKAPAPEPCSSADFAEVELEGESLRAPHVRCERWVAVTAGSAAGIVRIASCGSDRCGPMLDWNATPAWSEPIEQDRPQKRWPHWLPWALAGAGVAVAAGVGTAIGVVAARSSTSETRFVTGGLKSP